MGFWSFAIEKQMNIGVPIRSWATGGGGIVGGSRSGTPLATIQHLSHHKCSHQGDWQKHNMRSWMNRTSNLSIMAMASKEKAVASSNSGIYKLMDNYLIEFFYSQELKEGLNMDPDEADDLGLPSANELVARKLKMLVRRLMKSRCALAPPKVKVKGECLQRIVATLLRKFSNVKNDQRIVVTPFLAVKHKHVRHSKIVSSIILNNIFVIGSTDNGAIRGSS